MAVGNDPGYQEMRWRSSAWPERNAEHRLDAISVGQSPHLSGERLGNPNLRERGNAPLRADLITQAQRTYGNRAVQRFLGPYSAMPVAPRVSVQRQPDEPWLGNSPILGGALNAVGAIAGGPAVGTPSWWQTLNRHATGFEMSPQEEALQAALTGVVGATPGPIGTVAGIASLGHNALNAIVAPALGDREEASRARHDMVLDAAGLVPGLGTGLGLGQLAVDAVQMGRRHAYPFTRAGDPSIPGWAERTREEYPLSGDLFRQIPFGRIPGVFRDIFTAPPILDEVRPYSE